MEQKGSNVETILISEEILHPLVQRHLDNVSAAQWAMLASGKMEPELEAVITGLLTDIIQTVSTVLLKMILPKIQEMSSKDSESTEPSLPSVKPNLGDSLLESFRRFFNSEQQNREEGKVLTELAEAEIEEKVRSYLSEAARQETLPSKPALFVNGITSNIKRLGNMVSQAARYLKGCLSSPNTKFGKQWIKVSDELCLISTCPKSPVSVKSVTECISEIVIKWSEPEPPKSGPESAHVPPPSPSRSAKSAAAEIVNIILDKVKTPEKEEPGGTSESGAPRAPHFDMTLIVDRVKELMAPSAKTDETERKKKSISKFTVTYFKKLKEDLNKMCKKKDQQSVVNLANDPRSPQDGALDFVLQGSIPDTPKPSSETRQKRLKTVVKNWTCEMNFDTFKRNLDDLMTEMTLSDEEFLMRLDSITKCSEVKNFSKELTDKMYDHLMTEHIYHMPIVPKGRCLSDSVISKTEKKMDGHRRSFSPEVLYAMTEDAVGKFVQQILLFMIKDTSEPIAENENALGALREIENFLKVGIPTPEETKAESESSQESAPPSIHLSQAGEQGEDVIINQEDEDVNKTAEVEDEKAEDGKSVADEMIVQSPYEEEENLRQACRESPELSAETLTNNLAMALLLRLLSKCETDHKNFKDEITEIKRRLLFLVVPAADIENCEATAYAENLKDALNVSIEALKSKFGSGKNLLDVAVAEDSTEFDMVLITTLKDELYVKRRTKKTAIGNEMEKAVSFLKSFW